MPASLTLSLQTLLGFSLVLTRVSCALAFVPIPGFSGAPAPARAAFTLGFTLALVARWPAVEADAITPARLAGLAAAEGAIGIGMGLCVAIVLEAFAFAAQMFGMPAGYGYASTIDPTTQADAGILIVISQLIAGLLFFSLGLDREVLRLFGESLDRLPPGSYGLRLPAAERMIRLSGELIAVGTRLALPVVALLAMVDVALALMGRVNAQLQLLSLAFPAKMLTALLVLTWIAALFPRILLAFGTQALDVGRRLLGA